MPKPYKITINRWHQLAGGAGQPPMIAIDASAMIEALVGREADYDLLDALQASVHAPHLLDQVGRDRDSADSGTILRTAIGSR